jgi:calcium/calmodulin-dependent protein kinase I
MVIEFSNLVKLSHENIVKMYELYVDYNDGFQSESSAYVIMDFIDGQEMFEVINELGHYSEMHAKALFK